VAGWAAKNAFKSLHWLATLLSSESSISTANTTFQLWTNPPPACAPCSNKTAHILCHSRWDSVFLPTAVTVMVTFSGPLQWRWMQKAKRNCKRSEQRDNIIL